ncbi:MAG: hypothetical protein LC797_07235 [Chloroflexi bacterium]|nr:hypothetical protein [Chloroflexota bacterium]
MRNQDNGTLVHRYPTEGAALAFVRDVVRVVGRDRAATFTLARCEENAEPLVLASGADLVQRALEDRAE